jgi:SAM-dependent methyltransferase
MAVTRTTRTTPAVPVDPTNAEALEAWDGPDGAYWAEHEAYFDDSVARYDDAFWAAAAVAPETTVLDVGCGNGQTTREAARRAAPGTVLGVDLSSRMLDVARRRAAEAGLDNARFLQADAQVQEFEPGAYDLVLSRTGTMFFGDPVRAFTNLARALRADGRLALLVWQSFEQNHWVRDFLTALDLGEPAAPPPPEAPSPFSFADPARGHAILAAAGFVDVSFDGVEEPMRFGRTADEAYRNVSGMGFCTFKLRDLDDLRRERALALLRATIDAHATDEGVLYPSAAWIVTARRP